MNYYTNTCNYVNELFCHILLFFFFKVKIKNNTRTRFSSSAINNDFSKNILHKGKYKVWKFKTLFFICACLLYIHVCTCEYMYILTYTTIYCCCWVASVVSDSVRPHSRQPTRLLRPWDSPGENTGVGCHFLLPNYILQDTKYFRIK